jgi:hypothetical protein
VLFSVPRIALFGLLILLRYSSVGSLVPQIDFFGIIAPSCYSSVSVVPSNRSFWVFDASTIFELWAFVPQIALSGLQRLGIIRVRVSLPRIALSGL